MDRRAFIKVTAVTGTSATLASCGNPEHQLIRFVPDEEHVPGVAEWKPSLCPLCSAGCGLLVRVMEGDAEVVRGGQTGLIKMGLAKKLEGNPAHPISQGKLCARGQAAIQITYHPDRITASAQAHRRARQRPVSGNQLGRSDGAARVATRRSRRGRQSAGARVPEAAIGRPPRRSGRAVPRSVRRAAGARLRAVRRRCPSSRQPGELRPSPAADVRSREDPLRHLLRRRLPRHVELARRAERRLRTDAAGAARRAGQIRPARAADVADRRQRRRMGSRSSLAPKAFWRSASRT